MIAKIKKDKKSDFLSVRIPPKLKEKLLQISKEKERSLSWIIGKILEKYLKEDDGKKL